MYYGITLTSSHPAVQFSHFSILKRLDFCPILIYVCTIHTHINVHINSIHVNFSYSCSRKLIYRLWVPKWKNKTKNLIEPSATNIWLRKLLNKICGYSRTQYIIYIYSIQIKYQNCRTKA